MADARDLKFGLWRFFRVLLRVGKSPELLINTGSIGDCRELMRFARHGLKVAQNVAHGRKGLEPRGGCSWPAN